MQQKLFLREIEVIPAIFLYSQHRVLSIEELFQGTIDGTAIYPREAEKWCLAQNVAPVTRVYERVLDHLVVGANDVVWTIKRALR